MTATSADELTPARLKQWRQDHNLSRIQLAALLGVDRSTIWRWENVGIDNPLLVALALDGIEPTSARSF